MEYKFIDHNNPLLTQVIELGRRNSQTLGLMPRDAYIQQAKKRCIVIAFKKDQLIGYCLFRTTFTKHRIGITQVCVEKNYRGNGIAGELLNQVKIKYGSLFGGMLVSCREDYTEACELWVRFGFVKKMRVQSRSTKEEHYLLKFWYSFGNRDLFSLERKSTLLRVALDLNIIIMLHDRSEANEEIRQLLADWLTDEVEYCYANETLNEIHRDKDHKRTSSMLKFLGSFTALGSTATECEQFMSVLTELHVGVTPNHYSDRKQLAECKASNVSYFVTTDEELLSNGVAIYERLAIHILRPGEFILELDELKNRRLYEPIRLQGARFEIKNTNSSELQFVVDSFLRRDCGEKKVEFKKIVYSVITRTTPGRVKIVTSERDCLAAYGTVENPESLTISFLRIGNNNLANTLFYQLLVVSVQEAIRLNKGLINLHEQFLTPEQEQILIENGFHREDQQWIKLTIGDTGSYGDLVARHKLSEKESIFADDIALIENQPDGEIQLQLKLNLERRLWPIKFDDLELPVFIVPIKPIWASQLFDFLSANESLFGSPPELSWSKENVYYRSVHPNVESAPGRILWYASQQKGFCRQKAIIACSYLNEVTIGEAKVLYSTFRRFGVYKWPEVHKLANRDVHHPIKVLRFSDTEVFQKPVGLDAVNKVLLAGGYRKQTFVSPVKVNHKIFNSIYRLAK